MKIITVMNPIVTGVFLITFVTACYSESSRQTPAPQAVSSPSALHYVTSHKFVKSTAEWCKNHRGEFTPHAGTLPQDLVDCLLPETRGEKGKILGSVYDYLYRTTVEKPGYGLYSYVLFPAHSSRGERFLDELFKTTSYADLVEISTENLNLIYLPTKTDKLTTLIPMIMDGSAPPVDKFTSQFYDYALAQRLLAQICLSPADVVKAVCATDLTRGPYLFTYSRPASALSPAPPPYLFVDLSSVHEDAFGELVSAYKEQVKRSDYSDLARIENFKERLLNIILTSADTLGSITEAIKNAIHLVKGDSTSQ